MATRYRIYSTKDGAFSGTNTGDSAGHDGLVPYTGASGNVDLGANDLLVANITGTQETGMAIAVPDASVVDTAGGSFTATAGTANGTENGGSMNFNAGMGGDVAGNGGSVSFSAGNAQLGDSNGGNVTFASGVPTGTGVAGTFLFQSGAAATYGKLDFSAIATSAKNFAFPNVSGTVALTSDIPDVSGYLLKNNSAAAVQIDLKDNDGNALTFYEGANAYMLFDTRNGIENVFFAKKAAFNADVTFANAISPRLKRRVVTTTDDATAVIDTDVTDVYELSAVANATTFTLTGTPNDGQELLIRFKDAGVAKGLTWTGFTVIGVTLPTTTVISKWHYVKCEYNTAASQWHVLAVTQQI